MEVVWLGWQRGVTGVTGVTDDSLTMCRKLDNRRIIIRALSASA